MSFMKYINLIAIYIIKFYQYTISPYCKGCCRFTPTCSNYAILAFKKYGIIRASFLSIKRISKCFPGGGSGYDPLP